MSTAPGKIIETVEIVKDRPRHVDQVDSTFLKNRNHIISLLRPPREDDH